MERWIVSLLVFIILLQIMISFYIVKKINALKIERENVEGETNNDNGWEDEVKKTVQLQCMAVRNTVQRQMKELHVKEIQYCPRTLSITEEALLRVYSGEEAREIRQFWNSYQSYVNEHWLTENGAVRTVFTEKKAQDIRKASEQLTYHLNEQLHKIMEY